MTKSLSIIDRFRNLFQKPTVIENGEFGLLSSGEIMMPGKHQLPKDVQVKKLPMTVIPKNHIAVLEEALHNPPMFSCVTIPGSYPINTATTAVSLIPLTNVVLNWSDWKEGAHKLDSDLKRIELIFGEDVLSFDVALVIKFKGVQTQNLIIKFKSLKNFIKDVLNVAVSEFYEAYITSDNYQGLESRKTDLQDELKFQLGPILEDLGVEVVDVFMNTFRVTRLDELQEAHKDPVGP